MVIEICRESRVLRLASLLSFSSAVPPLAVIALRFEPGMAAGIDRVRFHPAKVLLHSLRLWQSSPLGIHKRNYHRDRREAYYAFV